MTQVNWGRPLALATLLVVLGSTAYWLEYSHKPKKEEAKDQEKKLFSLKSTATTSIRLIDGNKTLAFKCLDISSKLCKPGDNSKWEVTEPVKLRADDSNVNALLSTLNNLTTSETILLNEETPEKRASLLKEYGLDATARASANTKRIEVLDDKNQTRIVYFGEKHPIQEAFFALAGVDPQKVDESRVFLAPTHIKASFEHELTYWRDKKLLSLASHQIKSFKLQGSKASVAGDRKDGQWTLNNKLPGDIENIDGWLSAVAHLNAKTFVAEKARDPQAKAALQRAKPVLTLTLVPENTSPATAGTPSPVTLVLYEKKAGDKKTQPLLYATVSNLDPVFQLEYSTKDRLDKSIKDLRLVKLITSMDRFSFRRMRFEGVTLGKEPLLLASADGKWMIQPSQEEIDADKVQQLLDKLSGNRIKDFIGVSKIPTGEQTGLKVSLGDDKTENKRQFIFWKNHDSLYARDILSGQKEAFIVDSAIKDALPWDRNFFAKAKPTPAESPVISVPGLPEPGKK
jgi:hypothetical protein